MDLNGKGVFLTGGARGIGRGMAEALLAKGAKVLFCDILSDAGKATEEELHKQYGSENVSFVQCDVTNADQLKAAFDLAVSKFGAVDICINNAGVVHEINWEKMIAVNAVAQIRGSQLALDHMRRDRGGRGGMIINTASVAGLMPAHFTPVYGATKHAIVGFTTSWAKNPKMAEMGVQWRVLCPYIVLTDLVKISDDQSEDAAGFLALMAESSAEILTLPEAIEAFMKMVQDENSTDVIYQVSKPQLGAWRKRQLVDSDGVSNLFQVD